MFFVAIAVALLHISTINGMTDFDIENVLSQLHKKRFSLQRGLDKSLERDERIGYDSKELIQSIVRNPQFQIGFPYKDKKLIINEKDRKEKHDRLRNLPWSQLNNVKPAWLKPNNYPLNNMEQEDGNTDLGDYSKVYLVLDPEADMTKSDIRDLSNIVSSVLTAPNTLKKSSLKDRIQKKRRYKGFIIKDNRRRMRDSKEKYTEKDSIERDYKPKRPRLEYSGRGGGRTAIPYIGHRGDIFERE